MASTGICAYCGAPISSSSRKCPQCGADNPLYVVPVRGTASDGGAEQPASTGTCPYCGGTLRSDQKFCTNCGAENPHFVKDTPRRIQHPRTIGELKEYCAERGMPLLRMRFFIRTKPTPSTRSSKSSLQSATTGASIPTGGRRSRPTGLRRTDRPWAGLCRGGPLGAACPSGKRF